VETGARAQAAICRLTSNHVNSPFRFAAGAAIGGGLRLEALLGAGGISLVWRAQAADGRTVALKLPRPELAPALGAGELIRREFRLLRELSHPNVITTLGLIELETAPALVTEYLDGGDLVSLAGAHPRHWASAARDVAHALAHIHAGGIVHRDVKARNVLLRSGGEACLIDFALAAPLGGAWPRGGGTAAYQSLGQRRGEAPSVSNDIHALAVLLHELLTGRLPFGAHPGLDALEAGIDTPGPALPESSPVLGALRELIVAALDSTASRAPGSVCPFEDVLESLTEAYY